MGTPKLQLSLGLDWRFALLGGQASAGLQTAYSSAQRCNAESQVQGLCLDTPALRVGGPRQRLDGRLGWDSADQRWGIFIAFALIYVFLVEMISFVADRTERRWRIA